MTFFTSRKTEVKSFLKSLHWAIAKGLAFGLALGLTNVAVYFLIPGAKNWDWFQIYAVIFAVIELVLLALVLALIVASSLLTVMATGALVISFFLGTERIIKDLSMTASSLIYLSGSLLLFFGLFVWLPQTF